MQDLGFFRDQGLNLALPAMERGALTTRPPGNSSDTSQKTEQPYLQDWEPGRLQTSLY